jgi:hypothetical protein
MPNGAVRSHLCKLCLTLLLLPFLATAILCTTARGHTEDKLILLSPGSR